MPFRLGQQDGFELLLAVWIHLLNIEHIQRWDSAGEVQMDGLDLALIDARLDLVGPGVKPPMILIDIITWGDGPVLDSCGVHRTMVLA